jgi:hypothetical protein
VRTLPGVHSVDEEKVGAELHALDDRARDERGGDDREGALVGEEEDARDGPLRLETHPAQHQMGETAREVGPGGEGERVSGKRPGEAHEAQSGDAHHHRIEGILAAHHAAVEEGESGGHQQNQRRGDEHPGGVGCVQSRVHGSSMPLNSVKFRVLMINH